MEDLLSATGYKVLTASNGKDALEIIENHNIDLVLLDVLMPGMNGYEVCRAIRNNPSTETLPVIMVTAMDETEDRVEGIEAGADDFLTKSVNRPEMLARVKSLLRIKHLHDKVHKQTNELKSWSSKLEERVKTQVAELEKLGELKRFLTSQIVDIISSDGIDPLKPHRRKITVVFLDLRGFTPLTGDAEPEEVPQLSSV